VGLVFIAVSNGHKQDVMQRRFFGDRERVRRWASQMALDMVRRMLM
jgi:nicotinamide mononucleotide (NMN) deamidase PncC